MRVATTPHVCETLAGNARYRAAALAGLTITNQEPEAVHLDYAPRKDRAGAVTGAYTDRLAA